MTTISTLWGASCTWCHNQACTCQHQKSRWLQERDFVLVVSLQAVCTCCTVCMLPRGVQTTASDPCVYLVEWRKIMVGNLSFSLCSLHFVIVIHLLILFWDPKKKFIHSFRGVTTCPSSTSPWTTKSFGSVPDIALLKLNFPSSMTITPTWHERERERE